MDLIITLRLDNDAFSAENGGPEQEVARILIAYARRLNDGMLNLPLGHDRLRDLNGNLVGTVKTVATPEGE